MSKDKAEFPAFRALVAVILGAAITAAGLGFLFTSLKLAPGVPTGSEAVSERAASERLAVGARPDEPAPNPQPTLAPRQSALEELPEGDCHDPALHSALDRLFPQCDGAVNCLCAELAASRLNRIFEELKNEDR